MELTDRPDMQQIYLLPWAFLFAFMYHECLLFFCYEYEHRRKALEVRFITSGQPALPSGCPLTYSTRGVRQLFVSVTLEIAIHSTAWLALFPVLPTPAFISQPWRKSEIKAGVGRTGNEATAWHLKLMS